MESVCAASKKSTPADKYPVRTSRQKANGVTKPDPLLLPPLIWCSGLFKIHVKKIGRNKLLCRYAPVVGIRCIVRVSTKRRYVTIDT